MIHGHDWIQIVFAEHGLGFALQFKYCFAETKLIFQLIEYFRLKAVVFCEDDNHWN